MFLTGYNNRFILIDLATKRIGENCWNFRKAQGHGPPADQSISLLGLPPAKFDFVLSTKKKTEVSLLDLKFVL
jgi:hypothetical protein